MPDDPRVPPPVPTEPATPQAEAKRRDSGEQPSGASAGMIRCPQCSGGRRKPHEGCGLCLEVGAITRGEFKSWADGRR